MKDPIYNQDLEDWLDALENLILFNGKENTKKLLSDFISHAVNKGLIDDNFFEIPFINSISSSEEDAYPGNWEIEETIRHFIRWNALVTVLKANQSLDLGGHISTYSSGCFLCKIY